MDKTVKEFGFMILIGIIVGIMFNTALLRDPINPGGILGGAITGLLMYIFS